MRVIRGAEVGSDHHLVLMKVRLKVQRQKSCRVAGKCKLRVHKLESREAKIKFQQELGKVNRQLREVDDAGDDVEKAWKEFRLALTEVAERVVGRSRGRQRKKATAWWNEER